MEGLTTQHPTSNFQYQSVLELEQAIISSGRPDAGLALAPQYLVQAIDGAQVGDFVS